MPKTDPWITTSMRHAAMLAVGDEQLYNAYTAAQQTFLNEASEALLPHGTTASAADYLARWPQNSRWVELLVAHVLPALKQWYTRVFRRSKHSDGEPPNQLWSDVESEYYDAFDRDEWANQLHDAVRDELHDSDHHGDSNTVVHSRISQLLSIDAPIRTVRDRITQRLRQGLPTNQVTPSDSERTHRNQARTRARHSAVGAANRATLDVADQSAETLYKSWLATPDERVRNTHWHSNKQSVEISDTFSVGTAKLRYPGDPTGPPGEVRNCRCTLLLLDREEHDKSNEERDMELPHRTDPDGQPLVAAATDADTEQASGYWRAELAPLETRGDYRVIGLPDGGEPRTRNKMWLSYQAISQPNHDGSVVVGRIDRAWIENNTLMGEGVLDMEDPTAQEVHRKLTQGFAGTVSVDLDDATAEERHYDANGEQVNDYTSHNQDDLQKLVYVSDWRLGGATLVAHPAFHDAAVSVDPETTTAAGNRGHDAETRRVAEQSGHALPGGRYVIDNEDDLHAAIQSIDNTGESGSGSERSEQAIRSHIKKRARALGLSDRIPQHWSNNLGKPTRTASGTQWAEQVAAAARNSEPHSTCFTHPELSGPTKITVTDDGRVYGHVACWDTDHISFPDRSVKPPQSETGYAMFHRHPVRCGDGPRIKTGVLVMGTSHADLHMSTSSASQHYDHSGHIVADVRAGEDEHGIWVAGALHPEVTPLQVTVLDRYSLSGDWRGGELVAALVVNTPGFPIPENLSASGELGQETPTARAKTDRHGDQYALVAAGIVAPQQNTDSDATATIDALASEIRQMRTELNSVLTYRADPAETVASTPDATESDRAVREAFARIHAPRFASLAAAAGGDARPKRATTGEKTNRRRAGETGKSPASSGPNVDDIAERDRQRRDEREQQKRDDQEREWKHRHWESERQREHEVDVLDRQHEHDAQQQESQREHEEAAQGDPEHEGAAQESQQDETQPQEREHEVQENEDESLDHLDDDDWSLAESFVGLDDDEDDDEDSDALTAAKRQTSGSDSANWVDEKGGLPQYIKRIKKHLVRQGMSESHGIATAVNVVKKMCATGDLNYPGRQDVNKVSRAEACAAVARWEAMKGGKKSGGTTSGGKKSGGKKSGGKKSGGKKTDGGT